ncbi:MAG: hypothetical protein H6887_15850 [Hoeflea sp.]|nr:hypothetical protein [Hoeflea sp.]
MRARAIPFPSGPGHLLLRTVGAIALAASGFLVSASGAQAGAAEKVPSREMVFSIVRKSDSACEPDCPEWIAADGDIRESTETAFKAILEQVGSRDLPLLINSFGGRVDVAMAMGRLIRERNMTVEVARTDYRLCEPWDNTCKPDFKDGAYSGYANLTFGVCNSACPILLAGGVRRIAGPFARVGVHQIVTTRERYRNKYKVYQERLSNGSTVTKRELVERKKIGTVRSTELRGSLRSELENYLSAMNVKPALIELMLSTPPEDIRYLSLEELKSLGVVTDIHEIERLVGAGICRSRTRPQNCLLRN